MKQDEIDVLKKVILTDEFYKNKKRSSRSKILGFYFSELKSIKLTCDKIIDINNDINVSAQIKNSIKNFGLVDDEKLTELGEKLLNILMYNDSEILKELEKNGTVDTFEDEKVMKVEFFLYLCAELSKTANREGNHGQPYDVINNLKAFFNELQCLLDSTTRGSGVQYIKDGIKKYIDLSDKKLENLYLIQAMNWSGKEISRFLRLPNGDQEEFLKILKKAINEYDEKYKPAKHEEEIYEAITQFGSQKIQKDIRYRVKYAMLSYVLFQSITRQNSKIKINEFEDRSVYKLIIDNPEKMFNDYGLRDIYEYVMFDRGKYVISNVKKITLINNKDYSNLELAHGKNYIRKLFNVNDKVILVKNGSNILMEENVLKVKSYDTKKDIIYFDRTNKLNKEKIEKEL